MKLDPTKTQIESRRPYLFKNATTLDEEGAGRIIRHTRMVCWSMMPWMAPQTEGMSVIMPKLVTW